MLDFFKRNEIFKEDYENILNIKEMKLFQENKIILLTDSYLMIYGIIEKKLLLSK
jgi:hypothetical protein